jgi:hypothetical protein
MAFTKERFLCGHEDDDSCSYDYCDNIVLMSPVLIKAEKNKFICQGEITSLPENCGFHGDDWELLFSEM